ELISETTAGFKNYELDKATRPITDFIDDLSVWYLRRSRDRLKGEHEADKAATLATLRFVLQHLALVMAPSMPFYAEYLWQRVREEDGAQSVHLGEWPKGGAVDSELLQVMQTTREIVSLALEQRAKANLKVRQPLGLLSVTGERFTGAFVELIEAEVNVKQVAFAAAGAEVIVLDTTMTPELRTEGDAREFIRQVQEIRKKAGLQQHDRIKMTVQSADDGEAIVNQFADDIKKTVGADTLEFGDADGTEVKAGEHAFTVQVEKV
ncbi:class I tRNA ligase family protein, partial [Candidatus Pacebacteria bacterium]|nr:class I tRNA ligase family protein [Candidatus Paceibacterota bacterium]